MLAHLKIQIRKTPKEGSKDEWEAIGTRVEVRAWRWKRCKNKNSKGVSYWVRKDVWEWRWRLILFHWFHSVKESGTDEKYGMGHLFDKRILLFTLIQVLSDLQTIFSTFIFWTLWPSQMLAWPAVALGYFGLSYGSSSMEGDFFVNSVTCMTN